MAVLDRGRGYGEIMGGSGPAKYEQDGRLFDSAGNEIGAPAKRTRKKADAVIENDAQIAAILGETNAG